MTAAPPRSCAVCTTPLPSDAQFCYRCGARTPTQISGGGTETLAEPITPDALDAQRALLQQALGADYVVEELLGSGGFAQVWAAQDKRLQRRVAVKVLHPELVTSRALIERFQREAQAVAKLRHPGIVPIYSVGESGGLAYYVMPLIEGQSLREQLRGGPLPVGEARRILREIAAALAVAHRAGIVHRDIKPENVMLDGEDRRVLVMDFGIAKSTQAGATGGLTGTGMVIGTPAYMSPEQASASKDLDARSDVYSLGVLGFELLTGRTPFEADNTADLIVKQVTSTPPSLSAVMPNAPQDLDIAINRCLAKEPGDRWPNAGDLAVFLERQATPTGAPAPVSKDLLKFARRRWRPTRQQVRIGVVGGFLVTMAILFFTRRDLFFLAAAFWRGTTEPAGVVTALASDAGWPRRVTRNWQGDLFALGGSSLVVIDRGNAFEGIHSFDGTSWTSLRSPEAILAAAQSDNGVLLFGDSAMYRLSGTGLRREASVPFPMATAWSRGPDVLGVSIDGDLAWRTASGWQRQPTPRRTRLMAVFGPSRNRLFVLGYFATGSSADSIVEYTGVSWESVDPRTDPLVEWVYDSGAVLGDGSVVVGGRTERSPLLLVRDSAGRWRRRDLRAAADFAFDIWGLSGRTADSLLVWNGAWCDHDCLAEIRPSGITLVAALRRGGIRAVTEIGGIPFVLRTDGTIWSRRSGQWAHVTEVPNLAVRYRVGAGTHPYVAWATVGDGLVRGGFSGDPALDNRSLLAPSLPVRRFRGVAVGHHEAWLLGDDGKVYRANCRGSPPCLTDVAQGLNDSIVALVQNGAEGGIAVGARGQVARTGPQGWQVLRLPPGAERESLVAVGAGLDSGFVVLGRRRVIAFSRAGTARLLGELPPSLQAASLVAAMPHGGAAVATAAGKIGIMDSAGSLAIVELHTRRQERVTALLALEDGRVIASVTESADDPYAAGRIFIVRRAENDHVLQAVVDLGDELRSGLNAIYRSPAGIAGRGAGNIQTEWRIDALPLAPAPGRR